MTLALVFLVLLSLAARRTQAAECLEPASRVISRWKNGNYYKGEIESITNRVNVLFDNGARRAYNPRDTVDVVVDRIPDHTELPWGSQVLVNRPKSRAFEIGYIRDIKNGRYVILYENGDMILHTMDQVRAFNKSQICDEPAYLGCFRDNLPRDLQVYIPTHPATIGACVDTCKSQGFSVGALRNSDLCFCGNAYRKSSQVADKECDMPCYDNSFEVCGGFMTFSQYWTGIVDSTTGTLPGIQKHFIPSNDPIPWELLMHARSKYPPRHMPGSTRGSSSYQTYASPWRGNSNIVPFQQQRVGGLRSYPSTYQAKLVYPQNRYQGYQRYYGAKSYQTNYNQLHHPSTRYNFQIATNTQPRAYDAYQSQANRWPYNYNYNSYKYRNFNFQDSAANRPYHGYQGVYQRRPAPIPSLQEKAKLMGLLKKVSWTLFKEIHGTSKLALGAPRFLGCYQDSESRDLPTAVEVRPLTVEGCVSKCGESGFSIAGLQSSTQCFCGTTYSKYGRLQNGQCTMRCTGNYQEICGGVMMNSLYYTGIGQAIPYVAPPADARIKQITFTKNTPTNSQWIEKSGRKQRPVSPKIPLQSFHKVALQKAKPKVSKSKDKPVKSNPKTTQLKHKDGQSKGRPLPIQDYGKLTKILQTLSRWRQPHKSRDNNKDQKMKPALSYKELRKVLDDMTPEIVKKIADKIIAHDNNRTKLSDMKPLGAEKSLQVHLESSKLASEKNHDPGFKRVHVKSFNYKNWSKKGNSTAPKVRNKHEDVVQEDDARPITLRRNGAATKAPENNTSEQSVSTIRDPKVLSLGPVNGEVLNQSTPQNNKFNNDTQESTRYATKAVFKVQTAEGTKIPGLPSFIPIADKRKKHRLKSTPISSENQQNGSRQLELSHKELMPDEQSNKRTFVHFIVKESHDKKKKLSKNKSESSWNKTHSDFNETESTDGDIASLSQEEAKTQANASIKTKTAQKVTSKENQTAFDGIPFKINPAIVTEDVDEVFGTNNIPSNNKPVENEKKSTKNEAIQIANKTLTEKEQKHTKKKIIHPGKGSKTIVLKHPRIPHKVLHVEAKWNGQIKVKANWKEVMELDSKPKKKYSMKNNNVSHNKKTTKKFKESSGDDEGNDEYKFDDSGSRNELLWRHNRPLKDKVT